MHSLHVPKTFQFRGVHVFAGNQTDEEAKRPDELCSAVEVAHVSRLHASLATVHNLRSTFSHQRSRIRSGTIMSNDPITE